MPAAAVIPAPLAYAKVAAVKKLVVGYRGVNMIACLTILFVVFHSFYKVISTGYLFILYVVFIFYLESNRVLKAGCIMPLYVVAWDNERGFKTLFRWFCRFR